MSTPVKLTPMLQQYMEIKEQYPDTILFYRMGDFYEMFFDDAITASRVLGITLTSRDKKEENQTPMAGVPYHAVSSYLGKMVRAGFRVAICEQVEDPKAAKGLVRREVVRVVTPGVTTEEELLDDKSNRYVAALVPARAGKADGPLPFGLAFLDVSTGEFLVSELEDREARPDKVLDELTRMAPAELLIREGDRERLSPLLDRLGPLLPGLCLTTRPDWGFQADSSRATLCEHFQVANLAGFGCEQMASGLRAAGGVLLYIRETQKTEIGHIKRLSPWLHHDSLIIDDASRRNLELCETIIGSRREGSLLAVLDHTKTPMGARILKQRLLFPLQSAERINARLEAVAELRQDNETRARLAELLGGVHDLERLCARLMLGSGNARDMGAMKSSLARLPDLKALLLARQAPLLAGIGEHINELADLRLLLDSAIRDDAPVTLREGRLIREGYNAELDELIGLLRNGKRLILDLEAKERTASGMPKLKIGYNKVFGYYFEVSRAQAAELPEHYIRKQTLVNAERFVTQELKELEEKILTAQDRRLELEYRLFSEVRERIVAVSDALLDSAAQVARADFLVALAEAARRFNYVRPTINQDDCIRIREGRHPVIERSMEAGRFVPNDVELDRDHNGLLIITGPNMAGKSTVLRQTALIVLMAHIGSFVPAASADTCVVDRIFTRVGAMDDLRRGQSTFMVEMNETANILNNATERSLVILDEIGRGTSTYDGLAIAWAVAEELATKNGRGVKTLFATHYHELTDLAASHERVQNASIAVREWNDSIIFLHKLVRGATNRSYGIQVAGLAGVPEHVVKRAHEILANIEQGEFSREGEPRIGQSREKKRQKPRTRQLSLFPPPADPLHRLLAEVRPDETSPLEALRLLYEACALARGGG